MNGRFTFAADCMQRAGEGYVVDVMTRRVRQRSVLAPAGHAPVDESGITSQADVRGES